MRVDSAMQIITELYSGCLLPLGGKKKENNAQ